MFNQNKDSFSDRVFIYDVKQNNIYCYANDTLDISHSDINKFNEMISRITSLKSPACINSEISVRNRSGIFTLANVCFVTAAPGSDVIITVNDTCSSSQIIHERDQLTGLYYKASFIELIKNRLNNLDANAVEKLTLIYFDVQRFKTINDMFGSDEGDRLLKHISDVIREHIGNKGLGCRINSDRFVLAIPLSSDFLPQYVERLLDDISEFDLPFEVTCNAGIYIIGTEKVAPELIIDRAIMAQSPIKGSYIQRYNIYTEALREQLLTVQEITGMMKAAIKTDQFVVFYQPQYDHSNGTIVGAEGLVRWIHPERGLISPGIFVPVFEKNGFITTLDLYVFEKVCEFLKKCIDCGLFIVPLSTNLTRYDIFSPGFIDKLEEIRKKYNVPAKYLRIEITESVALGNTEFINESVKKLHSFGYIVEMDDFGSGYSSLNILKDIDFDMIKLDMKFLKQTNETNYRGGTILSSVVRMVNLLGLPIIAEGVETLQQADFLRSIGCDYIQGYLYSKPLPEDEYVNLIEKSKIGTNIPQMKLVDTLRASKFWNNNSIETLIFNNFVGGAAIFEYNGNKAEILRVNQKYLNELGMNITEKEIVNYNLFDFLDEKNKDIFIETIESADKTGEEQECETWRIISSTSCGEKTICIRTTLCLIGTSKKSRLFYAMIRDITAEKRQFERITENERRFRMACE